jgi:hypothetical protein
LSKPEIRLNRKSKPFWVILGENQIFSSVIRVPITFPPEKFNGVLLSAMCAPDLRGTQGTFTYFTDDPNAESIYAGGVLAKVQRNGNLITAELVGPANTLRADEKPMTVPIKVFLNGDNSAKIEVNGERIELKVGESSEWVRITFKAGWGVKVNGIVRFFLKAIEPHFGLYVTPINIDPDKPALPISHPVYYSSYLAKVIGEYATLGLAEDTWALNEGILTEDAFLEHAGGITANEKSCSWMPSSTLRKGAWCACSTPQIEFNTCSVDTLMRIIPPMSAKRTAMRKLLKSFTGVVMNLLVKFGKS